MIFRDLNCQSNKNLVFKRHEQFLNKKDFNQTFQNIIKTLFFLNKKTVNLL